MPGMFNSGNSLESLAEELVAKAQQNSRWRQQETINLIPSEQTLSPLVKLLTIADPMGRYAEHRVVKERGDGEIYYYQGTGFIAGVEAELIERMKEYLGCSEVEVRAISGQMANITVYSGLMNYLRRLDKRPAPARLRGVINHRLGGGGHLSAQVTGGLRDFVVARPDGGKQAVVNFPVAADNPYRIDLAATAELIEQHRPELIILGKSLILNREPVSEIARMVAGIKPKPIIMYDGAHVLGLFGPCFQMPLEEGADIIAASTHKTFFGTQRGIIASNMSPGTAYHDLWASIVRRVFPGSVSNHHLGTLLGLLMATCEMNAFRHEYQQQVITNAKAFARALRERGLQVEGDPAVGYTETHQVVLRVGRGRGIEYAERMEKNNIILNYQGLPDDDDFITCSGLRMGVQEMTRFGIKPADFAELAEYIAAVIRDGKDVARPVSRFRKRFTTMHYCLPAERAREILDRLITILLAA